MVCRTHNSSAAYHPRQPRKSPLYRLIQRHLPEFEQVYDDRYARRYGPWRPIIGQYARRFLRCGDLHFGFARVRCPDCAHEQFVPFSCRQRCLCPSCHQKRTLLAADTIARTICSPVPHRQLVFTIPKRLRLACRYGRRLLGRLARCAWLATRDVYRQALRRRDVTPGMIVGIQTFGELIHFHPHFHALVSDGAFTPGGGFLCLPPIDKQLLRIAWEDRVFELYMSEGQLDPATVEEMRRWPHSGFSVDNSTDVPARDTAALMRLAQYMLRCPFSLSRIIRVTDDGTVLYRAEPDHCRPFPGPACADLRRGAKRNFQVFTALDFLAEVTQHIPEKGEHLVRYYGWYSHRRRGMRSRSVQQVSGTALAAGDFMSPIPARSVSEETVAVPRSASVWAMLIQRIYEVDPLKCPKCGATMKIISFIERGQADVIERILKHCGLWEGPIRTPAGPRPPPGTGPPTGDVDEYELVLDGDFLDAESLESRLQPASNHHLQTEPGEYQLILDPEFL